MPANDDGFRIARIELHPGDVLVAKANYGSLAEAQRELIKKYIEGVFPGHKVIVMDRDIDLAVLSGEVAKAA